MINVNEKSRIHEKLRMLKGYVNYLREKRSITIEKLEKDYTLRSAIERNMQLALESALDMGEIIIASRGYEKPNEYKDIMLILGKRNVLPKEFATRFASAAGFRNILVHRYGEVDIKKLHIYLQKNINDFDEFVKHIVIALKKARK